MFLHWFSQLHNMISSPVFAASGPCGSADSQIDLGDCLLLNASGQTVVSLYSKPTDLVNVIVTNLFVFAGLLIFLMLIFAGFRFVTKGAKGKDDAKGIVQAVVTGFLVMFGAFWIVRIIEMLTGTDILF